MIWIRKILPVCCCGQMTFCLLFGLFCFITFCPSGGYNYLLCIVFPFLFVNLPKLLKESGDLSWI